MNIQAEKLEIMRLVLETDNQGILESIKRVFYKNENISQWNSLSEYEKEDILEGIEDHEKGNTIPYEEVLKELKI